MDGFEVVSTYTSRQGIDDGIFVEPFPEKFPWVLLTVAVHAAIEAVEDGRTYEQKAIPLLMDAVMIVRAGLEKDPNEYLWTEGLFGNVTGRDCWVARNDLGGFTVMFPEDY